MVVHFIKHTPVQKYHRMRVACKCHHQAHCLFPLQHITNEDHLWWKMLNFFFYVFIFNSFHFLFRTDTIQFSFKLLCAMQHYWLGTQILMREPTHRLQELLIFLTINFGKKNCRKKNPPLVFFPMFNMIKISFRTIRFELDHFD